MEVQVEERFAKIVRQQADELLALSIENAKLKKELQEMEFRMVTGICGKCHNHKLLPWKDDDLGNICVKCLYEITVEENTQNKWIGDHMQNLRNVVFRLLEHYGLEDHCSDEDLEKADKTIIEYLAGLKSDK